MAASRISPALLSWYQRHGRHHLPWKTESDPYRIWVSEIMLQQTQVKTVIPHYERFTERFPSVGALAEAPIDAVLSSWSGLGYYARGRNLHRAARRIRNDHGGAVPRRFDELAALPGIGRSTAGAILALAFGQRHPILDGNVKRVLARYHAVPGWPGETRVSRKLWALAEQHTPSEQVAEYTQAIMDLGSGVCTRTRPACAQCPLERGCAAHQQGRETDYPGPRPRRDPPLKTTAFLIIRDAGGGVLLERRPPAGIWGGLWSFPEATTNVDARRWCRSALGAKPSRVVPLPVRRHAFTHFKLEIHPLLIELEGQPETQSDAFSRVMEGASRVWYNSAHPDELGLAAPVAALLAELEVAADEGSPGDGEDGALRKAR